MACAYLGGMQEFIRRYSEYNLWANQRLAAVIETLSDGQLHAEIVSSFPSIMKTVLHIWDSQLIWIGRVEGLSLK